MLKKKTQILKASIIPFTQEQENELQRLVRKIKYMQATYEDMNNANELTRKKWKSQGIG